MLRKAGALLLSVFVLAPMLTASAAAAKLPDIMAGPRNQVPDCVTPGRLMSYLKLRNPQLDSRYDRIATEYMRHGEMLGVRWDFAFYQMIVETGALSYWRGNRHGDVKPSQNNFAGLGATGRGEPGESFPEIGSGVRAHLEHLLLYAGRPVDNPIAQRTRNVRDWDVLTPWQKTFTRPINFGDLATKWAPGTRSYASMLQAVAERFNDEVCNQPDPLPGLMQEARGSVTRTAAAPPSAPPRTIEAEPARPSGADLAQRAIDEAKVAGNDRRFALGAQATPAPAQAPAPFKVLNALSTEEAPNPTTGEPPPAAAAPPPTGSHARAALAPTAASPTVAASTVAPKAGPAEKAPVRTASAAAAAAKARPPVETAVPPAASQKCRVWTASYGGQKAMIIRSVIEQVVNFTVLDVNEGSETREAQAFISAYAKNGKIAGEYATQAQALDKAFELCPEG